MVVETTEISAREPARWASLKQERVYERLLLDIICGDIPAGSAVDEAAIARRYRTGLAGVRGALARLDLEGMVRRRPRLGSVVAEMSIIELHEVFELRVRLEGHCATLAARSASPEDVAAICSAYEGVEAVLAAEDWRRLVEMDRDFHRAVARAARNRWLARTIGTLHNNALRFWHFGLSRRAAPTLEEEIELHQGVAEAIARHDPEAAQQAMRAVLGQFPETISNMLGASVDGW